MPGTAFDKLDAAMDAFEQKKVADKKTTDTRQLEVDRFAAEFSNFRSLTAHPVLEEIGNRLRARGHEFKVEMDEHKTGLNSETLSITLHVFPGTASAQAHSFGASTEHPQFTIRGDSNSKKVQFHGVVTFTGGMQNGGRGECTLAEATAESVRQKAVDCIAESFGPRS